MNSDICKTNLLMQRLAANKCAAKLWAGELEGDFEDFLLLYKHNWRSVDGILWATNNDGFSFTPEKIWKRILRKQMAMDQLEKHIEEDTKQLTELHAKLKGDGEPANEELHIEKLSLEQCEQTGLCLCEFNYKPPLPPTYALFHHNNPPATTSMTANTSNNG